MSQSTGEYRVGSRFNPSGEDAVHKLKNAAAHFIDLCEEHVPKVVRDERDKEAAELFHRAMREAEGAAMWAVKGATKRVRGES